MDKDFTQTSWTEEPLRFEKTYTTEDGEIKPGIFLRTPYNYDTDRVSDETGTICPEETLTQQQYADDADINIMMERFGVTGEIPQVRNLPTYGDFTNNVTDYQSALNLLVAAKDEFMRQPAKIRAKFDNDPGKFMDFMENPENEEEIYKLGLATRKEKKTEPAQDKPAEPAKGKPSNSENNTPKT